MEDIMINKGTIKKIWVSNRYKDMGIALYLSNGKTVYTDKLEEFSLSEYSCKGFMD